jgi:multiple sugar transport system substrate-binding protein
VDAETVLVIVSRKDEDMQHKRGALGVLFLPLLAGMVGCPSGPAVVIQTTPAHAGAKLIAACPNPKIAQLLDNYSKNWANRQQAEVHTVLFDPSAANPPVADLWVIPAVQLPRLAKEDLLRTLPEEYLGDRNAAWTDLLPLYREQLLAWNQKRFGFPLLGEAPVCTYRDDLFQDPGHKAAFEHQYKHKLTPPQTWEQFAEIADYFHMHGPAGQPGPSLPALPSIDEELARQFFTIAACYAKRAAIEGQDRAPEQKFAPGAAVGLGTAQLDIDGADPYSFEYDINTGRPRIDGLGFVHALNLMRDLQPCRPPGSTEDPNAAFAAGKAVLCVAEAAELVTFQDKRKSTVRDKVGICRMPGGGVQFDFQNGNKKMVAEPNRVPYLGSHAYLTVVPKSTRQPAAAFALAAEMCSRGTSRLIVMEPGRWDTGPIRLSQLDETKVWETLDFDATRTAAIGEAVRQTILHPDLRNPALRLRMPTQDAHQKILVDALRDVLEGKSDAAAGLKSVALKWSALDAKNPAHLADYRMSLGLLPSE